MKKITSEQYSDIETEFKEWVKKNPPPPDYDFSQEIDPLDNTAFEEYTDRLGQWEYSFWKYIHDNTNIDYEPPKNYKPTKM